MADNTPNPPGTPPPTGSAPPPAPKHESGKIQPKKETVRINLPPKPTAAPTIKIPAPSAIHAATPGAGAATAAPAAAPAAPAAKSAAPAAAAAPAQKPAAPAAAAPALTPAAPAPARPTTAAIVYGGGGLDMVDKILAIAAAVVAIAVLVQAFMLSQG